MSFAPSIMFERVVGDTELDERKKEENKKKQRDILRIDAANRRLHEHMKSEANKLRYPFSITPAQRSEFGYDLNQSRDNVEAWVTFDRVKCDWNNLEPTGDIQYISNKFSDGNCMYMVTLDTFCPGPRADFTLDLKKV